MSISMIMSSIDKNHTEQEKIRQENGEEAAKEYECSQVGAAIGMCGGAIAGMAIGSVVPVVGSFVGLIVGGFYGIIKGLENKTRFDNLETFGKAAASTIGASIK